MKVLVTGANGFIGRYLIRRLVEAGDEVVGLDRSLEVLDGAVSIRADIAAQGDWGRAFSGVDTVFHLAGKVHALSSVRQDEAEYFRVNTEGTRRVLEAAKEHGVRRFVFFSSIKAMSSAGSCDTMGSTPSAPLDESDLIVPDTPYGSSKLAAESLVLNGGYVAEPVVLRLCMVYGVGGAGNLQQMLESVARRLFPPLPNVANRRSMIHVDDVITAALLASTHDAAVGEVFIVSDGEVYSTADIQFAMRAALGLSHPFVTVPVSALRALAILGDAIGVVTRRRFVFDSDAMGKLLGSAWFSSMKLQSRLGFVPEWNLTRALPAMVAALKVRRTTFHTGRNAP